MENKNKELKNPELFYFHSKERFIDVNFKLGDKEVKVGKVTLPRMTICGYLEEKHLAFGISVCHGDNYSRKLGRKISTGRAVNKPYKVLSLDEDKCYNIFMLTCKEIEKEFLTMKISKDLGENVGQLVSAQIEKEIAEMNNLYKK